MSLIQRILSTPFRVYNRTLRITREGWFFTGFTFAVGVAAINTANNLMYLVLAMMLAVMIVSGILSENALKSIRIERRMPTEAFASRPFPVQYVLMNPKRMLPSYSLRIQEKGVKPAGEAYALKLSAGERKTIEGKFIAGRRGQVNFIEARILTQFPFGLFEKTKLVGLKDQLIVFPSPIYSKDEAIGNAERGLEESGVAKGDGVSLFGLRDYRDGDNPKRIHWKVSARAGKLILKETENMDLPMMAVVLDTTGYRPGRDEEALEEGVSICAGIAESFIKKGYLVRLITNTGELPYGVGPAHLRAILTNLALFQPSPGAPATAVLRHGEAHVIVKGWES